MGTQPDLEMLIGFRVSGFRVSGWSGSDFLVKFRVGFGSGIRVGRVLLTPSCGSHDNRGGGAVVFLGRLVFLKNG